jgi:hypothetical protein
MKANIKETADFGGALFKMSKWRYPIILIPHGEQIGRSPQIDLGHAKSAYNRPWPTSAAF